MTSVGGVTSMPPSTMTKTDILRIGVRDMGNDDIRRAVASACPRQARRWEARPQAP